MRTRARFTKEGYVKFVGHLDTVRMFQRAIKVARIPIAYSQGFNPHSLVYFAMPLSVGVSSDSEYLDIVTSEDISIEEAREKLNTILPEGITLSEMFQVADRGPTLMSLVHEADYRITLPKADVSAEVYASMCAKLDAPEIITLKKGKKKTSEVDLKPLIRSCERTEDDAYYYLDLKVAAGSMQNLSPELLLKAVTDKACEGWDYHMMRTGLYTDTEEGMVSIADYGHL